jgi:MscS family membrane protein
MPALRQNREETSTSCDWTHVLRIVLSAILLVGSAAYLTAQLPESAAPPPPTAEPTASVDLLGRQTPHSAMMGFLKYDQRGDYATAARYLQPIPGRNTDLAQRAKELQALQHWFNGNFALLSDDPKGTVEPGLPPGEVRAGVVTIGSETTDVILVRVDDSVAGKIWLISKDTVANIPKLYAQMERGTPTTADRIIPGALTNRQFQGMSLAKWLGWLLSIPISWLLASLLAFLFSVPARIRCKLRKLPFNPIWQTRVGTPIKWIMAISIHGSLVYLLQPPLLYRAYYARFLAALLIACFVWLVSRIMDRGFEYEVNRTRMQQQGGESILILVQRLIHIGLLIIAVLVAMAIFGFDVKTMLAGLGIGGLAIALAAQKTLENLLGGISLLMDKAVQIGDFCRIGDQLGTVEDIGLRSLKLRTLDQNLLNVPNGLLAQMQFANMQNRPKLLINQHFSLRIETQIEQLRYVLDRIQTMLNENPGIEQGTSRVRVDDLAGAAYDIELFAYGKTGNWLEFTAIRQDVILKIAEIVQGAGARFAAPTRLTYLSSEAGVDTEKANGIVRRVTELRASDSFRFPGECKAGTK